MVSLMFASPSFAQGDKPAEPQKYELGLESKPIAGTPEGKVMKHSWTSKIFEGTVRDYYVYVPAKYDAVKPTAVMVFQDGHAYVNKTGEYRVPVVFDNLMAKGDLPPIIGIFVDPGHRGEPLPESRWRANNRSIEYDSLGDQYAKFLLEEILPEVGKSYNLTTDPDQRAICGASSGGICAWTVAWERPDAFRKVLSHIRQLHEHSRRPRLPGPDPQNRTQADPSLFARRRPRRQQRTRQLVARQSGNGVVAEVRQVRRPNRLGPRVPTTATTAELYYRTQCGGCGGRTSNRRVLSQRVRRGSPDRQCRDSVFKRFQRQSGTAS